MRKQTKLVAVLSAAALLAMGASMTSFAATGWVEEDGTWAFYDKDGYRVTDTWKKSVNNWFYLDENGEMATEALIENDDNYYYVDGNGAMVVNQWKSVPNDESGEEDEPENHWYYFQGNGKAYKASTSSANASFKTINGKKYVFDDEGKMQYGWVNDEGERQTGDDDWQEASYYCGDENDGAQSLGWKEIHVLDNDWDPESQTNGDTFDEDQDRWFFFKSNGKRYTDDDGDKTINGRKYRFDNYGRMIAEWFTKATNTKTEASRSALGYIAFEDIPDEQFGTVGTKGQLAQGSSTYSSTWRYYGTPEDGARVTKGWFQVVPSEYLNAGDYNDDEDAWYYSDGDGELYASQFKTINGKKYAFDSYGRMLDGLQMIQVDSSDKNSIVDIINTDTFDTEQKFNDVYTALTMARKLTDGSVGRLANNVYTFYFGDGNDGSMKTGKQTIALDGDDLTFIFEKSGSKKGRGKDGKDDDKIYLAGKQYKADSEEKYEVIILYSDDTSQKLELLELISALDLEAKPNAKDDEFTYFDKSNGESLLSLLKKESAAVSDYYVVNTSGTIVKSKSRCKNGDDIIMDISGSKINRIYEED